MEKLLRPIGGAAAPTAPPLNPPLPSRKKVLYSESELDFSSNAMAHMACACSVAKERQLIGWSLCRVCTAERTDSRLGYSDGNVRGQGSEECSNPHSNSALVSTLGIRTQLVSAQINASRVIS